MLHSKNSLVGALATLAALSFSNDAEAQIRVDNDGHVGLGTVITRPDFRTHIDCVNGESMKGGLYVDAQGIPAWWQMVVVDMSDPETVAFASRISGAANWYVVGAGWMYSQGSYIGSDESIKTNITEIQNASDIISALNGYSYEYNSEHLSRMGLEESPSMTGLLAQEVEQVLPSAVHENDEGMKLVNYDALIPVLLENAQQQSQQIEELTAQVEELRSEIATNSGALSNEESMVAESIEFFPNPANTNLVIKHPNAQNNSYLGIFDLTGKLIRRVDLDLTQGESNINVANLDEGMYIFSIISGSDSIAEERILISH